MSRREKRRRFSQWLSELFQVSSVGNRPRPILVEPLEARQLLAGDGFMALLGSSQNQLAVQDFSPPPEQWSAGEGESGAEGEATHDLVAFAKALTDSGTRFFGAAWCHFCTEQKQLFQDGYRYLPFVEVTNPDRTPNQVASAEGITNYPTWEFPDGTRLTGVQSLETLAQRAGVTIPQSSSPSMAELSDVNVALGSPLHVPIDAYDPNGNPLNITVTSSAPGIIAADVLTGNRSLKLSMVDFGDMVFELFEDRAARPASRVIQLAQAGFYNNSIFHRV
ncbi:MAG: peptidylprolyl isomerase, partial [Planctomycetales bacterium]|nr:peptidylprolyl isomerase [Planctomycetales bacterium]